MPLYRQWLEFRGKSEKLQKILKEAEEAAFASNPHRYANPGHDEFKEKWMENFQKDHPHWYTSQPTASGQGLVKGAILCFRNPYLYFRHGESTSTASKLTSPASHKRKDLNKVLLLLQDIGINNKEQNILILLLT